MTEAVLPAETLSRFIYSSSYFAAAKGIVKYRAFMPDPYEDLSVFRTSDWAEERIWEQGKAASGRTVKARGDLLASVVMEIEELFIDPDDEPPGHANIKGWPAGPENKSKRMELAMSLAFEAKLLLSP